ncbi:MAG: hypothetical protein JOZ53_23020, partial [Planctomycetaceae bacterium]|nr:hypothetical protein [Planctomycetaceae bacterium]
MTDEVRLAEYTPIHRAAILSEAEESNLSRLGAIRDGKFFLVPNERATEAYKALYGGATQEQIWKYCEVHILA